MSTRGNRSNARNHPVEPIIPEPLEEEEEEEVSSASSDEEPEVVEDPPAPAVIAPAPAVAVRRRVISPFDADLDPETPSGIKLFERATRGIVPIYTGGPQASALRNALSDWKQHIVHCRLTGIMNIKTKNAEGKTVIASLINTPRMITFEQILAQTRRRNAAVETPKITREILDSSMLFTFLWKSIGGPLKTHVQTKFQDDTIGEDGPALYKLIIEHVQGVATAATIRNTHAALRRVSLAAFNNSVRDLHHAVAELTLTLTANQAVPDDVQHILLNAYKKSTNADFQQFANRLADDVDDNPSNMTLQMLMSRTEAKFDSLVAEGKWNVDSKIADDIVALQAIHNTKPAAYNRNNGDKSRNNSHERTPRRVLRDEDYPQWKLVPPGKGEPKSKFVDIPTKGGSMVNKEHHWCPVHRDGKGLWCAHNPKECKMAAGAHKRKATTSPPGKRNERDHGKTHSSKRPATTVAAKPQLVSNHTTLIQQQPNPPAAAGYYNYESSDEGDTYRGPVYDSCDSE